MKTTLIASVAALGLLAAPVYATTTPPAKAPAAKTKVAKASKHAKNKLAVDAAKTKSN